MVSTWIVPKTKAFIQESGDMTVFLVSAFRWITKRPWRSRQILEQMNFVGNQSLFIITLTSIFCGMVFAIQVYFGFKIINSETLVGASVALAMTRELAPVFASLLVAGRAGAAMAAQIGTMRVTEQIDALEIMAVSPKQYLVLPRLIAGIIMLPVLSAIFMLIGNIGAYLISIHLFQIDEAIYMKQLVWYVDPWDIGQGLSKAAVFGLIITWVGTYKGYTTKGGAEGVGRATNEAVVYASVMILIADYFLTALMPRNLSIL